MQYACGDYVERLERRKIAASMSRPGNPYDNAKAESFMKTLKTGEVNGKAYSQLEDARGQIGAFKRGSQAPGWRAGFLQTRARL